MTSTNLRIAITRREYITQLDGINRFVFTLSDGLSELGHEVHVLSYSFQRQSHVQRSADLEAYVQRFFDVEEDIKLHVLTEKPVTGTWPEIALAWLWTGSRILNGLDVDVVLVNGVVPLWTGAVKIAVNHGLTPGSFIQAKRLKKMAFFYGARSLYKYWPNLTICVSNRLSLEFQRFMRLKCSVFTLPIKLHLFNAEPLQRRDPLILHIGTRPWKNVELSIKSFETLISDMRVEARLVVVGPYNSRVAQLLHKYAHLSPRYFHVMFNPDASKIKELLGRARALILPSTYEAFPYVVLEAFASGLPVVVSPAVPRDLVVNGWNGFRVYVMDPRRYAAKLAQLLTDDTLWRDLSVHGLQTAEKYSHVNIAQRYEEVFLRLRQPTPCGKC